MILYQIFDENSCTWFKLDVTADSWGDRKDATFWINDKDGPTSTVLTIQAHSDRGALDPFVTQRRPVIRSYDIWEARQVLHDLNAAGDFDRLALNIRAREQGCQGPKTRKWNNACGRARKIMQ